MALIVEDGSQVTNSNSYSTRAEYIAYAASIGVTIADTVAADEQLIKAAGYIDNHEQNLSGVRVERDQSMAYPRSGLYISGWYWSTSEIPGDVKKCQLLYALSINDGEDLYNRTSSTNAPVKREKIEGAVEVEYSVNEKTLSSATKNLEADFILNKLLKSGGISVQLVRA